MYYYVLINQSINFYFITVIAQLLHLIIAYNYCSIIQFFAQEFVSYQIH